ncbi:MAG TPA: ABC transporter permease [Syntrophomonadaceae bacterium]|nr:ABC transporter permease [Syntrophomonadaceae bacterium]HPU49539.1 ABC transporter permease [Syntrophomonadaceae bacterium]
MNLLESIQAALDSIRANKFRSILTTLGIVIGIAAVIAVIAIGQGGRQTILSEIEKIGSNLFYVGLDWRREDPPTGQEFNLMDIQVIKEQVPEIKYLCAESYGCEQVRGKQTTKMAQILGTNADYGPMYNFVMKEGRFFSQADEQGRRRIAALDEGIADELFPKGAVGEQIVIAGTSFTIVGVVKSQASLFNLEGSKMIYIPISTWLDISPYATISYLEGSTYDVKDVQKAADQAVKILERRHRAEGIYINETLEQQMEMISEVTGVLTLIIGSIAAISLLVGGIGVMNIMLVSVTERTREIGIRMALGARRRDILLQFLIEAIVLCLIGGIIGTALGVGGAFLVAKLAQWPPLISWSTILLAFLFSAGVGIVFGLLPANKASQLDPIEALRYE